MRNFRNVFIALFVVLVSFQTNAKIKLPALFTDNMMLQQKSNAPIWGWAEKNSNVTVKTSWDAKIYKVKADASGKWRTELKTPSFGGPFMIEVVEGTEKVIIKNILIGEVWLCSGQSNMEMPLKGFPGQPVRNGNEIIVKSTNKNIRLITIPRATVLEPLGNFEGKWEEASPKSTANFSATAWYFGSLLQEVLQVPVGLIHVAYGGSSMEAWMNREMLKDFTSAKIPTTKEDLAKDPNRVPTTLFNGMLSPVIGYGIKGCIWYQGESNYERASEYTALMKKMVSSWRTLWKQGDFPFYYCQIAPFNYKQFHLNDYVEKYNSAYIREAQLKATKEIPNSGMAVLMDIGEENNIHPMDKEKGGNRLAFQALAKTYGMEGFEFESPKYKSMEIKDNSVTVSFDEVPNGITAYAKEVTGFEIAGEDKVFYPAKAEVRRKSVVLTSDKVAKPVAVRYLWKDFAKAELFSTGGLPVSSFRTDEW
ncbi:sialate O-acetylesterase [Flavobacterium gilvum]|uniref:Sialate O-acetylesterase n=1 Tax=Flavobacterium gilvum TaxID=1492737 RepID=A0AAC9I1I9_9FLAO|nr:sialate O-acetylesterase [Flavobacterium gilvum]AOW08281.1 sialate O-acetylesterase [Flavobacterium gilvum]KFC58608.1 9-O-acetylesterase [Flavobacterium gilvum]